MLNYSGIQFQTHDNMRNRPTAVTLDYSTVMSLYSADMVVNSQCNTSQYSSYLHLFTALFFDPF